MPDTATKSTPTDAVASSGNTGSQVMRSSSRELVTDRGRTKVADNVVAKIAGIAAREIVGVFKLGTGVTRAFGSIRERVPGGKPNVAQGVSVEVGETQAAVDLDIVVEYGVSIQEVAQAVRDNIISAVERMTGLEVVEVNIAVDDIHLPDEEPEQTRLQ